MRLLLLALTFLCSSMVAFASDDGSQLTIEQWVSQDAQGNVVGRIVLPRTNAEMVPVSDVKVVISTPEGEVLRAADLTNAKGEFKISDVKSGVYTLLARGKNVFACCALHVVDAEEVEKRHEVAEIAAANIDYTDIKISIIRYMPPNVNQVASFESQSAQKIMSSFNEEQAFRVAQTNGGMTGRLFQAGLTGGKLAKAGLSNILVYQNGEAVAQTVSRMDGSFEFRYLEPGRYSLMSIGPDGLGITSFELISEDLLTASVTESGDERFVTAHSGSCCPQFEMQIAPCASTTAIVEEVFFEEVPVDPCGCEGVSCTCGADPCSCGADLCGCEEIIVDEGIPIDCECVEPLVSSGGGYGGGGGGYGGGGFGGIGGLAGLGIAAAALASDNNNGILLPGPVSPASP